MGLADNIPMDGSLGRGVAGLFALIVCPTCRGELAWSDTRIDCRSCGSSFEIFDGIPMFADPANDSSPAAEYKQRQIEHFEGVLEEFEIERPHGATAMYQWVIDEKHRRALSAIRPMLRGATALTVCGGSGMDGEYLARAGASVIVSDIALAAALRARERARRYGLNMVSIVADAEQLPFSDDAIDVVLVHDGLHHLADPLLGLAEMARVARIAVSVTEPARAAATAIAVKFGAAVDREEAGNRVERLVPERAVECLKESGFDTVSVQRYAMYYRHYPGWASRALSRRIPLLIFEAIFWAFNAVAAGIGNKFALVAAGKTRAPGAALAASRSGDTNGHPAAERYQRSPGA